MKFVYQLNRDSAQNSTISSPIQGHHSGQITLSVVGLDVGFDNPTFVALEANESGKWLAQYELDLGLNVVARSVWEP
jgi:splicing factor 3B subunit 3